MKKVLLVVALVLIALSTVYSQTTEFTYQGRLVEASIAASGSYDFIFKLFDDPKDPVAPQIGLDQVRGDVPVSNGIFSVVLNFGSTAFDGAGDRFLEIYVRPGSSIGSYAMLTPRQRVTSSPFAIRAARSSASDSLTSECVMCVTDAHIQSIHGSKVTGTVVNASNANNVSGIIAIANGGTGSSTQNFVDLSNTQTVGGDKTFTGILTGNGSGLNNVPGTFRWQLVSGDAQQAQPNNGYLADNSEQVTIRLPSAPTVGDTIRVTGIGAGGWKIAQDKNQAILGIDLDLTGIFWTPHESNRPWTGVASSADGTKLVAVARLDRIYTSTDSGVTWTPREIFRHWTSVASTADGSRIVAVGRNERIYVSVNSGATWTPRETGRNWTSVASSADGSKLVAVADGEQIYTSGDGGLSWTARETNRDWISVASSADGSKLVAAVFDGQIYTSIDSGASWTARESRRHWRSVASSTDGIKLVAADLQGRIYTSSNAGVNWIPRESDRLWLAVASSADGSKLVAAGIKTKIYTSNDSGISWTASETLRPWQAFATSADGTKLFAVTDFDKIYTSSLLHSETTTPGIAGYLVGGRFTSVELQYVGNGQFIPIGHKGTIFGY